MKFLVALLSLLVVTPAQAADFKALVPNEYVLQEHIGLNPEIWEYSQPLRTVVHYSEPKACEGKEKCVEIEAILEGPGGRYYVPDTMEGDRLAFDPSFVFYTSTMQVQCDTKATTFYLRYPHQVITYGRDEYGRRVQQDKSFRFGYIVNTHKFQQEICKTLWSPEREAAVVILDGLACALDPKYCKP